MTTAISAPRQAAQAHHQPTSKPMRLAGRLLAQFEEDLSKGNNERARLVNTALLELQSLMTPQQARMVERQIGLAWRHAVGCCF